MLAVIRGAKIFIRVQGRSVRSMGPDLDGQTLVKGGRAEHREAELKESFI